MKILNINDKLYPTRLRNIPDAPVNLYLEGNIELLNSSSIAIIGSRAASEKGKSLAKKFSYELSNIGITVISGLARGIDTAVHTNSYNQTGKTIAVLGCGFNKVFPPENSTLLKKIVENDGLIVSEYSPDITISSDRLRNRNRIISGLSLGVLVIEAKQKSGTGVTFNHAIKQHRPIFAIPHSVDDPHGVGTNRMLKNGAYLVTDTLDVLNKLKLTEFKEIYKKNRKSNILNKRNYNFSDIKQKSIFSLINQKPISANDLSRKSGYSVSEVLSTLFILEMNGCIKKVQGGYICM